VEEVMWRVGNLIRSHRHRISSRLLLARWNDSEVIAERSGARLFSRRFRGLEDPDEEEREEIGRKKLSSRTAADMDFYTQMADEIEEEDEGDEAARLDEEYRLKQEEIHLELDSRTGRPWTDPWDITEEQWMSTTTYDDLPDWSPEYVSRISQERVKIHPGRFSLLVARKIAENLETRISPVFSRRHSDSRVSCKNTAPRTCMSSPWFGTSEGIRRLQKTNALSSHYGEGKRIGKT